MCTEIQITEYLFVLFLGFCAYFNIANTVLTVQFLQNTLEFVCKRWYRKKELKVHISLCFVVQAIILVMRIQNHKQMQFLKSLKMQVLHNLYIDRDGSLVSE